MAQAWLRHLASDQYEAESAGLEPGKMNPFAVQAMTLADVDMSDQYPKGIDEIITSGRSFDYVVAVCDEEAAERCPIVPGNGKKLHWNFPDPSAVVGSDEQKLARTCEVRDLIKNAITDWLSSQHP
jgi:arsenate reductase